ncbi:MAG: hypothetical protein K9M54_03760 [Kiritimatiellales bacterium]|nr:hypothetical protein [Kiritimatiellales bacterium]MCF7863408.1 hypothetical protein [Kiritimatiellales bacterium]
MKSLACFCCRWGRRPRPRLAKNHLRGTGVTDLGYNFSGKTLLLLFTMIGALLGTAMADDVSFKLAKELLSENSPELAAVEFRRFSMETAKEPEQAAAYLYASYAYLKAKQNQSAGEMLDRAESADHAATYANEHALLSAENAREKRDAESALYFYDLLSSDNGNTDFQTFARRRAAAIQLGKGDILAARTQLEQSPADETRSLQALETYANGKDKSPAVGGLWGLIPGAGYWYSGEVANGFRSLILNSLFIYGMVQTADDDQWGAFGVISFFEITWYSGSIYGGVDAAQRYNRDRLETTTDAIEGSTSYRPDPEIVVPVFKLKVLF